MRRLNFFQKIGKYILNLLIFLLIYLTLSFAFALVFRIFTNFDVILTGFWLYICAIILIFISYCIYSYLNGDFL